MLSDYRNISISKIWLFYKFPFLNGTCTDHISTSTQQFSKSHIIAHTYQRVKNWTFLPLPTTCAFLKVKCSQNIECSCWTGKYQNNLPESRKVFSFPGNKLGKRREWHGKTPFHQISKAQSCFCSSFYLQKLSSRCLRQNWTVQNLGKHKTWKDSTF